MALKSICNKLYKDFHSLLLSIYYYNNFIIRFLTDLLISIDLKSNSYNIILVSIDYQIKMLYYKPVKATINTIGLAKITNNMML